MNVCIFDCDTDRGSSIEEDIRSAGYEAVAREHVWDTAQVAAADPKPDYTEVNGHFWSVEDDSVVFVHRNNQFQHYWRDFLAEKCGDDNWVVMYSGGGLSEEAQSSNPKRLAYPHPVGTDASPGWELGDFFEALVGDEGSKPFEALLGVDPILEAKLNLLHKLLLPSEELITSEERKELEEWNELKEVVQEDSDEQLRHYEKAWEGYQQGWKDLKEDLGDVEELYEEALAKYQQSRNLEDFRDKLLESALSCY